MDLRREQGNIEMPNLFVIGASKSGTTSLHHYLGLHPEVSMSKIKEPFFFLPEDVRDSWRFSRVASSRSEYLSLFEPGARIRGEASTTYSWHPVYTGVPRRLHEVAPDAKLIYLVRDPVERVPTLWVQRMGGREASNRGTDGPIPLDRHIGAFDNPQNIYTWTGLYMTQIRQYLEFFPRESLLVLDADELRADRRSVMAEVFRFLGVESDFHHPGFAEERNTLTEKKLESATYVRMTRSGVLRQLVNLLPENLRERTIEAIRRPLMVPAERPAIDPELRARLEDHFRPEVEELREFTGRPFAGWSV